MRRKEKATWTHHRQFAVFNECLFRSGSSLFWWQCCCLLSTEEQRYKTYPQSSSRCLSICFCSKEHLQHLIGGYRDPQSLTPQNSKSLNWREGSPFAVDDPDQNHQAWSSEIKFNSKLCISLFLSLEEVDFYYFKLYLQIQLLLLSLYCWRLLFDFFFFFRRTINISIVSFAVQWKLKSTDI